MMVECEGKRVWDSDKNEGVVSTRYRVQVVSCTKREWIASRVNLLVKLADEDEFFIVLQSSPLEWWESSVKFSAIYI